MYMIPNHSIFKNMPVSKICTLTLFHIDILLTLYILYDLKKFNINVILKIIQNK